MNDFNIGGTVPQNLAMPQQAPDYMQQPQQPQPAQLQVQPSSFSLDRKALEILGSVHPELVNAMVGLAIKKFANSDDFLNFFVREEFKAQAELGVQSQQTQQAPQQTNNKPSAVSFDQW